jgi:hypothetical protein
MNVESIENLDLYKCSLQDIIKAKNYLSNYITTLIKLGESTANKWKGTERYLKAKKLHILVSRARSGMDKDGYMIGFNTDILRLPNNKSVL